MFAIGIRYLNGWAMAAADGAKKERAEWPPHPDRIFMALAAAWYETEEDPEEGSALRWLETLGPPAILASDASFRSATDDFKPTVSYVPVNDSQRGKKLPDQSDLGKLKEAGLALLPEYRPRQPRRFPVAIPHQPVVFLVWPAAEPDQHDEALSALLPKVTHIGHPASFAQLWIESSPKEPNWVPAEGQTPHRLRVFSTGRLDYLAERYNRTNVLAYNELASRVAEATGHAKAGLQRELQERFGLSRPVSLRPMPGHWQGYDRPVPAPRPGVPLGIFDPHLIVLASYGRRLSLPATLKVTEALRGAVLAACPEPIPEWVSGHGPDGKPSTNPHLAFLPLAFTGHPHADGRLLGVALALPRQVDPNEAGRYLSAFLYDSSRNAKRNKLFDGEWLESYVELETRESPPVSLRSETWTGPSNAWATVTPLALDRHFDGPDKWDLAAESVKDGCEHIGLPRPAEVFLSPVSWIVGAPHVREFPHLIRRSDAGRIHHSHALILFDSPVSGPILVGAGRYRGYGLCRPANEDDGHG